MFHKELVGIEAEQRVFLVAMFDMYVSDAQGDSGEKDVLYVLDTFGQGFLYGGKDEIGVVVSEQEMDGAFMGGASDEARECGKKGGMCVEDALCFGEGDCFGDGVWVLAVDADFEVIEGVAVKDQADGDIFVGFAVLVEQRSEVVRLWEVVRQPAGPHLDIAQHEQEAIGVRGWKKRGMRRVHVVHLRKEGRRLVFCVVVEVSLFGAWGASIL